MPRLNTQYVKATTYSSPVAAYSRNNTFEVQAPSGYSLLVTAPIAVYASGDASAYITDRAASQSGSTVTVTLYVNNPNAKSLQIAFRLLFVKSAML